MAGDWIKMRENLHEDPAILAIAHNLETRPEHVVGYCHKFWSWVSRNCHDGTVRNVTLMSLESSLALPGFLTLMCDVGWLEYDETDVSRPVIRIPKFERHLSQGAKERGLAAERQRQNRVTKMSRSERDKSVTREEKRREDIKPPISPPAHTSDDAFNRFWKTYPRKVGRQAAKSAWKKAVEVVRKETLCSVVDATAVIERAAGVFAESDTAKSEFCPHPATWLNQGRYDDDQAAWKRNGQEPEQAVCRPITAEEGQSYNPITGLG